MYGVLIGMEWRSLDSWQFQRVSSPIEFLAWTQSFIADREHEDSLEFRRFRRRLFHGSLEHILKSLKSCMETPMVM